MAQQKITPLPPLIPHEKDETQRRQLRLVYLIVLTVWTFAAIAAPFVAFCLTKNPASFYGFSSLVPPIFLWTGFAKFVLMDERRFELEKMRLERWRGEHISSPFSEISNYIGGGVPQEHGDLYILGEGSRHENFLR